MPPAEPPTEPVRGLKTICLPCSREQYEQFVEDPQQFRKWGGRLAAGRELQPERRRERDHGPARPGALEVPSSEARELGESSDQSGSTNVVGPRTAATGIKVVPGDSSTRLSVTDRANLPGRTSGRLARRVRGATGTGREIERRPRCCRMAGVPTRAPDQTSSSHRRIRRSIWSLTLRKVSSRASSLPTTRAGSSNGHLKTCNAPG